MAGPCGWVIEQCGCGDDCWTGFAPAVRTRAATLAAAHMWAATGRRYGSCPTTVIICTPGPVDPLYQTFPVAGPGEGGGLAPYILAGQWHNSGGGCGGCTCAAACEVPLDGPVGSIVEVRVGGDLVDEDVYAVQDGHLLVRTDDGCWPTCGTVISPYGMTVTYLRGTIPAHIQAAAETLACQYARACTGAVCALPQRLASLSRQGVDFQIAEADPSGGDWWMTGVDTVDRVIAADNPGHLRARPQVLSLDVPTYRQVPASISATVLAAPVEAGP